MNSAASDEAVRVLHVDDDPATLDLVARYLERVDGGLDVVGEADAEAGLDRLADGSFDCVVSDYDMPGLDGLSFLARVRERLPAVPFLLYTGQGSEEIAAEAISQGVDDYLRKESGEGHYTVLANRIRRETERRLADREREQQLAALDLAREGICIVDEDGRFAYANPAYGDLYGYEPEQLVGRPWQTVHPAPEVDHITAEVLPAVAAEGEWSGRGVGKRADQSEFGESRAVTSLPGGGLVVVAFELREGPDDPVTEPTERAVGALDQALAEGAVDGRTAALTRAAREQLAEDG